MLAGYRNLGAGNERAATAWDAEQGLDMYPEPGPEDGCSCMLLLFLCLASRRIVIPHSLHRHRRFQRSVPGCPVIMFESVHVIYRQCTSPPRTMIVLAILYPSGPQGQAISGNSVIRRRRSYGATGCSACRPNCPSGELPRCLGHCTSFNASRLIHYRGCCSCSEYQQPTPDSRCQESPARIKTGV